MKLNDMKKLESPFEREEINGKYVCIPKFKEEFKWILDPNVVIATEKFDGTNVSIYVENGRIIKILNRTNHIDIWKEKDWFYNGIRRAIDEGKFKLELMTDGQYFGELIAPKIQGNPYRLERPLWLPFDYVKEHYYFKFYYGWLSDEIHPAMSEEDLFQSFSELIKSLKSLWFRKIDIEKAPEGIVFHNRKTGEMCKLRADMFDWFEGKIRKFFNLTEEELTTNNLPKSTNLVDKKEELKE